MAEKKTIATICMIFRYWHRSACHVAFLAARKRLLTSPPLPLILPLYLSLFRYRQRIIGLDAEITHGTFKFGVAKQKLNGAKILGATVNQGGFGAPHRVGAVSIPVKPDRCHPLIDDLCILPGRYMGRFMYPAWKQELL